MVCMSKSKQSLIDEYRYCNVENLDWETDIIERFREWMAACGVSLENKDIQYSGFCSQGDGARFECTISDGDFDTFADLHGLYTAYPILQSAYNAGCQPYIMMSLNSYGHHYCHDKTVYAELCIEYVFTDAIHRGISEDDVRYHAAVALEAEWDLYIRTEIEYVNEGITDQLRWYMRELYKALDTLYYELISDELVWECIVGRGWDTEESEDE